MNIKLHTPKSLKSGSGMSSLKQFLLSLLATTVSIALTFGTAAIVDHNKKQKEKREIVMMVMYDMYQSLESVAKADSMIRQSMEYQRQIAEDTSRFSKLRFQLVHLVPRLSFTETTEHIFSSSIESINTVGNVLFTENVAEFYQGRQAYKTAVCDSLTQAMARDNPFASLQKTLDYDYFFDAVTSGEILLSLQNIFAQCQKMMGVSNKELETYRQQRAQMERSMADRAAGNDSILNEITELGERLSKAKKALNLE